MNDLKKYLGDLSKKLEFQYPKEEIKDISNSVEEMIGHVLTRTHELDPRFEVRRILKVGSFFEGTKINIPNEFDFLVEIKELSEPGSISVASSCSNGCAHISIHKSLMSKWKGKKENDTVTEDGLLKPQHIQLLFWHLLREAVNQVKIDLNIKIVTPTGRLELMNEIRGNHPNTAIFMQWYRVMERTVFLLGADITICLPCPDSVLEEDIHGINMDILSRMSSVCKPVLVPPSVSNMKSCSRGGSLQKNCCWRISFTPIEVKLMQQLCLNHKTCYKILKYLCRHNDEVDVFSSSSLRTLSSYILKTAVLNHSSVCESATDICQCLKKIFDYLMACGAHKFLPNYMMPKKNTWTINRATKAILVPDKILSMLINFLFQKLANSNYKCYDFGTNDKILRILQRKFKEIEIEQFDHIPDLSALDKEPIPNTPLLLANEEHWK